MINNLPEKINTSILDKFDFGASDAIKDTLLKDCFCDIAPVKTFLKDKHSILVGAKGSGKTAIFKLLSEKHLQFENTAKDKTILVKVDEPIEYATIESIIKTSLKSQVQDDAIRYQFLWELYMLYCICLSLKKRNEFQSIKDKVNELCQLFQNENSKPTILQILASSKKSVGFKLNMSNPAFPSPDFYISTEPSTTPVNIEPSLTTINLEHYKKEINSALKENGFKIYILIDNIDDFVAKDSYNIQKMVLQGILNCSRNYAKFPNLRLKISIRSDLFQKLDFSQVGGYDKIASDVVELIWNDSDIRFFVARRLAFNLMTTLRLKGLKISVDEESLYLPPPEQKLSSLGKIFQWMKQRTYRDEREARTITAYDQSSREIILSVFPRDVMHRTSNGNKIKVELFSYLASHFDLGDEHPTPRIILLFLQKLTQISIKYYSDNPDQLNLRLTEKKEYPLFKRDHFLYAYAALQKDMLTIFKSCITHREWQNKTDIFFNRKGNRTSFSFTAFCRIVDFPDEDEAKAYIAYLTHLGVLRCKEPHLPHKNRTYELPLLLQYIWTE